MKKLIVNLLVIFTIVCGIFGYRRISNNAIVKIPLHHTQIIFLPKGSTSKKVLKDFHCTTVINGSYFMREESSFLPAGIRYDKHQIISSWINHPFDENLTNTIQFTPATNQFTFFIDQASTPPQTGNISFNAGPWLLNNNQINPRLQEKKSHRQGKHPRTVLAKDQNQNTYLFIFKRGYSLQEVSNYLKKENITQAINLDGGPSTSIATQKMRIQDFNTKENLPIFFCEREKENTTTNI